MSEMNGEKEFYMRRALQLAKQGMGHTSPNPMVGCVVVREGKIIAEGYHEKCGGFHAERNALLSCEDAQGAELYVTLEPCCHHGKTPPCTDIIIEKKIKKVYVGSMDPNPLVGGKGVGLLRSAGIEVECGILEEECHKLNEVFFHYIKNKTPFVVMKYAMTLDGKIASYTGNSKWITGEEARRNVQELRKRYSGILVGIGTVKADNPMLNCRIEEGVNPVRIICDSKLSIKENCQIVTTAKEIKTVIAYTKGSERKEERLKEAGCILLQAGQEEKTDLKILMNKLGEMEIDSVLIEGGTGIHGAALKAGIVNKVAAYIAPKIIGGESSKTPIGGIGIAKMDDALKLKNMQMETIGEDILVTGYLY